MNHMITIKSEVYAELLAACKAGLEASELRQSDHECHNDDCQDAQRTLLIRSAIAKAERKS